MSASGSSSTAAPSTGAFAADDRVYFFKETATWRYEADDGTEMEYDAAKSAWVPVLDEDVVKSHQAAYSVAGVDEEAPAAPVLARLNKKRKEPEDYTSSTLNPDGTVPTAGPVIKRGKKVDAAGKPAAERKPKNTAVYVTGLPADATFDELVARFRKYGVLEEDDAGVPKVKMYASDGGAFSGDALVVFFKEDSVALACAMLDDAELRPGAPATRMRVQRAEFGHKGPAAGGDGSGAAGVAGAAPRKTVDRKKATRRITNMQKKLEDWDDEDEFGPSWADDDAGRAANKHGRVVVLKHMFTLQELKDDPSLLLDLKEDVREECETLGEVTNVVLYDNEAEGVMTIKFRDPISAQACVIKMNGRFFAGRQVEATLYTGKQRFKRSAIGDDVAEGAGSEEAEKARLAAFSEWLMAEGD